MNPALSHAVKGRISPTAALYQAPRVALVRKLDETAVRRLVEQHIEGRQWDSSASRG